MTMNDIGSGMAEYMARYGYGFSGIVIVGWSLGSVYQDISTPTAFDTSITLSFGSWSCRNESQKDAILNV